MLGTVDKFYGFVSPLVVLLLLKSSSSLFNGEMMEIIHIKAPIQPFLPRGSVLLCSVISSIILSQGVLLRNCIGYSKMNHCNLKQNAFSAVGSEEMRGPVSISDLKGPVVCPKPRRVGVLANNSLRPLRWHMSHPPEVCDSKAGAELLDIILMKEGYGMEQSATQFASSPPYFCGSPPSRSANPLIQDARFGDEKVAPSVTPSPSGVSSPSSSSRKGGCVLIASTGIAKIQASLLSLRTPSTGSVHIRKLNATRIHKHSSLNKRREFCIFLERIEIFCL
nr:hypothetical protein CFP56_55469 [Quercus suber]